MNFGGGAGGLLRLRRRDEAAREGSPLFEAVPDDDPGELVDVDAFEDAPGAPSFPDGGVSTT